MYALYIRSHTYWCTFWYLNVPFISLVNTDIYVGCNILCVLSACVVEINQYSLESFVYILTTIAYCLCLDFFCFL